MNSGLHADQDRSFNHDRRKGSQVNLCALRVLSGGKFTLPFLLALTLACAFTPGLLQTAAPSAAPIAGGVDMRAALERLGGHPYPGSEFTRVRLSVPIDHFAPAGGETLEVVFAVRPADGERTGLFVVATGGPGTSGLAAADWYAQSYDPGILEHFDIVFFDQRGAGLSGGLQCPRAAAVYYQTDSRAETPEQEAALVAAAQTFAQDCITEMGPTDLLPYLGSTQAVEDLEDFRQAVGDEKFWLYGESYGTQFAQTYAAAHPEHLAGLILDGTVDLTLSAPEFYAQQAQAFSNTLIATLEACNVDPACAADVGGDALAAYDDLAARLAQAPLPFTFPLPSGRTPRRTFTLADLEAASANYLYSEGERMMLQRAIAAAARDDLLPLARILYDSLGLDPETLEAVPDPTYSDAAYYAIECSDYDTFSGTPAERAQAYIRAGDAVDEAVPRLGSIFYGDLPCVFWPATPPAGRPAPLVAQGIPTLVLGATADPATPVSNGESVYRRLADGYLITMQGGPHVIFGWGNSCPDDIVTAFLVRGTPPEWRETSCVGAIADDYVPLPPASAAEFASPQEALISADDEIYYLPEYYMWDLETPTAAGCPHGGTLEFEPADEGERFTLSGCAFSAGFVMTGTGLYDYDAGRFTLDVAVSGLAEGHLTYTRESDGEIRVEGAYDGQTVK
jgi:pimeloyl-ACP methyl ester carboxylesterase